MLKCNDHIVDKIAKGTAVCLDQVSLKPPQVWAPLKFMGSVGEVVWYLHADSHNMKWYYAYRVVARYYDNRF